MKPIKIIEKLNEGAETKAGNDIDELCAYVYSNYLADDRDFPSREEFEYIADVTANEYKKIKYLCTKAYDKVKDHLYNGYIELNDNPTMNYLNNGNKTVEDWVQLATDKLYQFEYDTGVEVWQDGRSGRHIIIRNNYYNASHYDELKEVQERLEQEAIDEFNGEEDLEESSDWDYNTAESWRCNYPEPHYKDEDDEDEYVNDYPDEERDMEEYYNNKYPDEE